MDNCKAKMDFPFMYKVIIMEASFNSFIIIDIITIIKLIIVNFIILLD
jgi:hypothetical protein